MVEIEAAERIYAERTMLETAKSTPGALGVADLLRFLEQPSAELTLEQTRYLFSQRKLREAFAALKRARAVATMPALAAASSGEATERSFPGGSVTITQTPEESFVYLLFTFLLEEAARPHMLVVESEPHGVVKLGIPAADVDGEALVILDKASPKDERTVAALLDPRTTGVFLRL
jgi:hypothetical protein